MRKTIIAGAVGIAMGGAALAAPAHAYEFHSTPYTAASVVGDMTFAYHDDDRWEDDDWDDDDDYWKKRRKAERKYWKKRRKAERRYYRDRQRAARYRDYDDRYYDDRVYRDTRVWRGRDGRVYCRKRDGTTGLIVGGALGALLGREIDTRGDRTLGTVLGAAGGALIGREIERGRCR
ncbi:glycine zipper 2TM domain-containing protein [Erythrobacter sp. THAF29]|uniref:glycine zipper 2TM domain-containing protein n=1 Tax=Erythrobacter sp. THAF29 TaxID=2587851 RepID=UPI00126854D3|nr:glycine zipper 2TM domain-containing protein [Erythrobacter sp. THAF29]QFT76023.1 Glycine zipper 2TM domain protein [Erythrobacter sp. THAF29]